MAHGSPLAVSLQQMRPVWQFLRGVPCAATLLLGCQPARPATIRPRAAQRELARVSEPVCRLPKPGFSSFQIRPGDARSVNVGFSSASEHLDLLRGSTHARVQRESDGLQLRGFISTQALALTSHKPTVFGGYLLSQGPLRLLEVRSAEHIEVELIEKPQLVQPTAPLRAVLRCADLSSHAQGSSTAPRLQDLQVPSQSEPGAAPAASSGPWYLWGPVKSRQQLAEFWDAPVDWVRDTKWERSHRIETPLSLTPSGPPVAILRGGVQRVEVLAARGGARLIALEEKQALIFGWVSENELLQRDAPLSAPPPDEPRPGTGTITAGLGFYATRTRYRPPPPKTCDSQIEFDSIEVQGPLARRHHVIQYGIEPAHDEVLRCFVNERQRRPSFEAELQIELTIDASGSARRSEVKNPVPAHAELERCITQALQQHVRLPGEATGSTLVFPVRLQIYDGPRCLGAWSCRHDVPVFVKLDDTHHEAGVLRARTLFEAEPAAGAAMVQFQLLHRPIELDAGMELTLRAGSLKNCSRLRDEF